MPVNYLEIFVIVSVLNSLLIAHSVNGQWNSLLFKRADNKSSSLSTPNFKTPILPTESIKEKETLPDVNGETPMINRNEDINKRNITELGETWMKKPEYQEMNFTSMNLQSQVKFEFVEMNIPWNKGYGQANSRTLKINQGPPGSDRTDYSFWVIAIKVHNLTSPVLTLNQYNEFKDSVVLQIGFTIFVLDTEDNIFTKYSHSPVEINELPKDRILNAETNFLPFGVIESPSNRLLSTDKILKLRIRLELWERLPDLNNQEWMRSAVHRIKTLPPPPFKFYPSAENIPSLEVGSSSGSGNDIRDFVLLVLLLSVISIVSFVGCMWMAAKEEWKTSSSAIPNDSSIASPNNNANNNNVEQLLIPDELSPPALRANRIPSFGSTESENNSTNISNTTSRYELNYEDWSLGSPFSMRRSTNWTLLDINSSEAEDIEQDLPSYDDLFPSSS